MTGYAVLFLHGIMRYIYGTQNPGTTSALYAQNGTVWANLDATSLAAGRDDEWRELASTWWFILGFMLSSGTMTVSVYYYGARLILKEFYEDKRDEIKEWKCQQPFLTQALADEERWWGCFNAFQAGFFGVGLYFLHVNYNIFKLEFNMDRGWGYFVAMSVFVYMWIDLYSYLAHRALHHKWIYKYVHKWHHRYKQPTPFSAFCMHPIEFITFQSAGIACLCVFPMHVVSFLGVVTFIAYHNQIDHSGVFFEGDMPWLASTKYHDDHHKYFHLNFGLHFVCWDWMGGTLRKIGRTYDEDTFVGEQDKKKIN